MLKRMVYYNITLTIFQMLNPHVQDRGAGSFIPLIAR